MGWFSNTRHEFAAGQDSILVKNCIQKFISAEGDFAAAYNFINQDLSRMHNYHEQFRLMQGLIDKISELTNKHEEYGTLELFLNQRITINPFGKITVQEGFQQLQLSANRIHHVIKREYFKF